MAVGFHTAGGHQTTFRIDNFRTGGRGDVLADGSNFAVVADENAAVFNLRGGDGLDVTVFDQ